MGFLLFQLLAFTFILLGPARSQQCSGGPTSLILQFADVGADQWIPAHQRASGSLDPLYDLVHSYLDIIQQNPLPTGKLASSKVESQKG